MRTPRVRARDTSSSPTASNPIRRAHDQSAPSPRYMLPLRQPACGLYRRPPRSQPASAWMRSAQRQRASRRKPPGHDMIMWPRVCEWRPTACPSSKIRRTIGAVSGVTYTINQEERRHDPFRLKRGRRAAAASPPDSARRRRSGGARGRTKALVRDTPLRKRARAGEAIEDERERGGVRQKRSWRRLRSATKA